MISIKTNWGLPSTKNWLGKRSGVVKTIWLPMQPIAHRGEGWQEGSPSDQTVSFGEFAFTARSALKSWEKKLRKSKHSIYEYNF